MVIIISIQFAVVLRGNNDHPPFLPILRYPMMPDIGK